MFRYLIAGILAGPFIIWDYFVWMIKYSMHPEKYPLKERYARVSALCRRALLSFRSDIKVVGKENIPNESCLLVCNHLSMFDPLTFLTVMNDTPLAILAKKETSKIPFVGRCVRSIDGEYIDRGDIKQSLRVMMSIESDLKKENKHWLIFPEGTRSKDPRCNIGEFHHGTFRPAYRSEVPIIPCCVYGTFRVGKLKPTHKKYPIYIEFGTPILYKDYKDLSTQEIAVIVRNEVQKMLSYHARKYDSEAMSKFNPDTYNRNE